MREGKTAPDLIEHRRMPPHRDIERALVDHSFTAAPTIIETNTADSMYARKQRPMVAML
jgi:hypothetical protein